MNISSSILTVARRWRAGVMTAALCASMVPAIAQDASHARVATLVEQYPRGSIDSVQKADEALAEVGKARSAVNARYTQEEQACMPLFFATSCIEKAKEKRHQALVLLRRIELESNAYKRQVRARERDAELAEKQQKAEEKRLEAESAPPAPPREAKEIPPERAAKPGAPQTTQDRVDEHEAKREAQAAKELADAPKRAAKAEAYERKVQASLKRQQEVARRKAEKEEKQRNGKQSGEPAAPAILRP